MKFPAIILTLAAFAPVFAIAGCEQCSECVTACTTSNCPAGSQDCDGWCATTWDPIALAE
ncbi:hypothetical protein F5Y18DRAFT_424534 [Xylariaceae sp. FL1019]|nr:hypothetical protein F5Y18DRAFT_424534 [Xylariaceae sp. FL1019]